MFKLSASLNAWGSSGFETALKAEIEGLDATLLPLQQGMSRGGYATGDQFRVMIIGVVDEANHLRVKTGIFYTALITGCSCADDPTPIDELPEYCVLGFDIDKRSAQATVYLLDE